MTTTGTINRFAGKLGVTLVRHPRVRTPIPDLLETSAAITDVSTVGAMASSIPGMLSAQSGDFLLALCLLQSERGDVVEIGSWQGRSTTYLATAVKESGNGRLYAIDHFRGNPGTESSYQVSTRDLSDLRENFISNMATLGFAETVHLLDCRTEEAAPQFKDRDIRFLFIDGDHTYEGVSRDFGLFEPQVVPGGLIVLDDVDSTFPGIVQFVDELLASDYRFHPALSYPNTLVLKKPSTAPDREETSEPQL